MRNLTDKDRETLRGLYIARNALIKKIRKNKNKSGVTVKQRATWRTRLEKLRAQIRKLAPPTEKQKEAARKLGAAQRIKAKNNPAKKTDLVLTNDKKKGKEIIKNVVKTTAIEHQKDRERAAKEKKETELKEKIKKENAKTVTDKGKETKDKKNKTWVWATLVMGLMAMGVGAYLLIKKYKKELKKPKIDDDGSQAIDPKGSQGGDPKKSDGRWFIRET